MALSKTPGGVVDAMLAEVYETPKDVVARATKAISSEGQ
jgi:hypothetical protein